MGTVPAIAALCAAVTLLSCTGRGQHAGVQRQAVPVATAKQRTTPHAEEVILKPKIAPPLDVETFETDAYGPDAFKIGHYSLVSDPSKGQLKLKRDGQLIWTKSWPQAASPAYAFIAEDGKRVALVQTAPGFGNGRVVVFLDEKGEMLAAYRDEDLIPVKAEEPEDLTFHQGRGTYLLGDQSVRLSPDRSEVWFCIGAMPFAFRMSDGAGLFVQPEKKREILQPYLLWARKGLTWKGEPNRRMAIETVALLGDRPSIPILKKLLDDRTRTGTGFWSPGSGSEAIHELQTSAGLALAMLLRKGAIPLLKAKLKSARGNYDRQGWEYALQTAKNNGVVSASGG